MYIRFANGTIKMYIKTLSIKDFLSENQTTNKI